MNISVIIPTYNRASIIERALESVLLQSSQAQEIIVVDDASTDNTAEILEKYSGKIRITTNLENRGVSFSRNAGIQAAMNEWIAFLDSDDQWESEKLEKQKQFHADHPELMISQCDEIWIRNGVRVNPMDKHAKRGGWIFEACVPICIVSPSAVIIHKQIFKHIGLFDVNFLACEDYDLWLRIAPHYEIGLLADKLVTRFGGHEDQLSRKYWGMDRFRITAMEKHVASEMDAAWKKTLLEELEFKCGVVAAGAKKRNKLETATLYFEKQQSFQKILNSGKR
ncbi:MAG: glycosyltransferase family 2 protein [Candidatus Marinimicrobia bacterium]|nr:glycosyltransferase family 2 protein [Candidatus Neomarinimicrobiota bacterium]MBT3631660.1 glycosyltransferase family 2 protein [Candidatus Neomarinimicrobiota bacterium]MBT3825861.1 glycosyltransferase family 2 protein [Candidatus Neomarinimicrobiota bacterium]MBT4129958.1 glycosyltransferase family 2 protein [Candidatus Neomarinimicrobiota bacterium]MBT4296056.1 glycosyltransferase family 2 protein [Candidatus Neomarinimicrobiota bacterium]